MRRIVVSIVPKRRIAVLIGMIAIAVSAAVATASAGIGASPTWLHNCKTVNQRYPHGVGRVGAHDHTTGTPVTSFKRSNALYALVKKYHPGLDRDHDGIACEAR
jgi:hypothetical protein